MGTLFDCGDSIQGSLNGTSLQFNITSSVPGTGNTLTNQTVLTTLDAKNIVRNVD